MRLIEEQAKETWKKIDGCGNNYAAHTLRRIEEYQEKGNFLEKDVVVWD